MRWWALGLYGFTLRLIAFVSTIFALAGFVLSLILAQEVQAALARNGLTFQQGIWGVYALNLCGLAFALLVALAIFATGQLLMLLISLEENLRGLRADLRSRRRGADRAVELPGPQQPPPRIVDDMRNAAPARYRQQVQDNYGPPMGSPRPAPPPRPTGESRPAHPDGTEWIDGVEHPPGAPRPTSIRQAPRPSRDNDAR